MGFLEGGGIFVHVEMMRSYQERIFLVILGLSTGLCCAGQKSYSSGGGHSYSSHSSSSHSSGSGGGRSSSSGSSHSSGGASSSRSSGSTGSKSFSSGSGKSYGSGSNFSDNNRKGYSSSKSYSSGSGKALNSAPTKDRVPVTPAPRKDNAGSSGLTFDTTSARARKEEASKEQFTKFKQSQSPPPVSPNNGPAPSSPFSNPDRGYRHPVYVPDPEIIRTRPTRVYNVYHYYNTRPWITYRDPYSSFFWWWLLDRALDDRAWWAYHHRYDMDPARYAEEAAAIAGLGFTAYKMRPGRGPEQDLESVRMMRKAVGPDFDLMVDAHTWWRMGDSSYSAETVDQMAQQLAKYDAAWLEEPLPPDDHEAYLALREKDYLSIAGGEHDSEVDSLR